MNVQTKANSFENWNLVEFLKGRKRLLVTLIGIIVGQVATHMPGWAVVCGVAADMLYAIIDFYLSEN